MSSSSSPPRPPPSLPLYLLHLLLSSPPPLPPPSFLLPFRCVFSIRQDVSEQLLPPLLHHPALLAGGNGCKHVRVYVWVREREGHIDRKSEKENLVKRYGWGGSDERKHWLLYRDIARDREERVAKRQQRERERNNGFRELKDNERSGQPVFTNYLLQTTFPLWGWRGVSLKRQVG